MPQLEKECRNLLKMEISKIEKTKNYFASEKKENEKREDMVPIFFNLMNHKQD